MLPDGAESLTESDDENLAAMLKEHVPNMDARVLWAAIMLRDKAQELGIPCVAYGGVRWTPIVGQILAFNKVERHSVCGP
jgi:hypothetical protein